jgi:hypothetical protein
MLSKYRLDKYRWAAAPLMVASLILVITLLSGGLYIKDSKIFNKSDKSIANVTTSPTPLPSPSEIPIASYAPLKTTPRPKSVINPTPTPIPQASTTSTPNPTSAATSSPSPSSSPTPTPQPLVICDVHFDPTTGVAPVEVKLIYGASYGGGDDNYVTNVQWDWDGDGNWDTDFSVNNQHLTHIYQSPGTYNARMHLQTKGGATSDVCTGSITIS